MADHEKHSNAGSEGSYGPAFQRDINVNHNLRQPGANIIAKSCILPVAYSLSTETHSCLDKVCPEMKRHLASAVMDIFVCRSLEYRVRNTA